VKVSGLTNFISPTEKYFKYFSLKIILYSCPKEWLEIRKLGYKNPLCLRL